MGVVGVECQFVGVGKDTYAVSRSLGGVSIHALAEIGGTWTSLGISRVIVVHRVSVSNHRAAVGSRRAPAKWHSRATVVIRRPGTGIKIFTLICQTSTWS